MIERKRFISFRWYKIEFGSLIKYNEKIKLQNLIICIKQTEMKPIVQYPMIASWFKMLSLSTTCTSHKIWITKYVVMITHNLWITLLILTMLVSTIRYESYALRAIGYYNGRMNHFASNVRTASIEQKKF